MRQSKKKKNEKTAYQNVAELIALRKWFVVKGIIRLDYFEEDLLAYANTIGVPSARDGGVDVWPVRPRANDGTFSETASPAPYHTDAQYRDTPESAFLLGCKTPAAHGGISKLLAIDDIMTMMNAPQWTREEIKLLHAPIWRWQVPRVFQRDESDVMCNRAPILLDNGGIRWRYDNLIAPTEFAKHVAAKFNDMIETAPATEEIEMTCGDVLVASNVYALHARTGFTDVNRSYSRVRLK